MVLARNMVAKEPRGYNEWVVSSEDAHQRLGVFLREKFRGRFSAKQLKRWMESNLCEVNGAVERFASRQVMVGDRIRIWIPSTDQINRRPAVEKGRILYEDADVLLYNKSPGVTSEILVTLLDKELGNIQLVHRLDRDTSGVMLFSRHDASKRAIEDLFRRRLVSKTYLAVVDGVPKQAKGVITNYLGKLHAYEGQAIWGAVNESKGQYAETAWQCLSSSSRAALIECFPKTGRTHQIRVHMKGMGHAILGDYQYERHPVCSYLPTRPLLHAARLALQHPISGNQLVISAAIPADFLEAFVSLKIVPEPS